MNTFVKAGRIHSPFGLKGELNVFLNPGILHRIKSLKAVFMLENGQYIPYFITDSQFSESGQGSVKLEAVDSRTAAEKFKGKEIYLDEKKLGTALKSSSPAAFIGFQLQDETGLSIGELEDVIDLPGHQIGKTTIEGQEVLFPFHDHFIAAKNLKEQTLRMKFPEGLLSVYLKNGK